MSFKFFSFFLWAGEYFISGTRCCCCCWVNERRKKYDNEWEYFLAGLKYYRVRKIKKN